MVLKELVACRRVRPGGSAANNSAAPYGCAAAVNCATSSVGSPAAILVSRVAIAAARIAAAGYDCSTADNCPPANGGPTTISRSTANCCASVDAAPPSGGSSLSLQSLAIYRDTVWKG